MVLLQVGRRGEGGCGVVRRGLQLWEYGPLGVDARV